MSKYILLIFIILLAISIALYFLLFKNGQELPESSDLIKVYSPLANQTIKSPVVISGEARGFWFFEASFPIKLIDENGNLISQGIAQAQSDWMTEDFVPFQAEIEFQVSETTKGFLVLERDNPSGLPENDAELRIPVYLEKTEVAYQTVKLYYYNPQLDKDNSGNTLCSRNGLVAVDRQILITNTPIQDTIKLLLKGELSQEERNQGITTEYSLEGFF